MMLFVSDLMKLKGFYSFQPGDVLLLVNLHYYVSLNGNSLIMHEGGMRYKRGIRILSDSSYHKKKLLR